MVMLKETSKSLKRVSTAVEAFQKDANGILKELHDMNDPCHRLNRLTCTAQDIADRFEPILDSSTTALESFTLTSSSVRLLADESRLTLAHINHEMSRYNRLADTIQETVTELNAFLRLLTQSLQLFILVAFLALFLFGLAVVFT